MLVRAEDIDTPITLQGGKDDLFFTPAFRWFLLQNWIEYQLMRIAEISHFLIKNMAARSEILFGEEEEKHRTLLYLRQPIR